MKNRVLPLLGALFLSAWWIVSPALTYNQGTSENIYVEVLAEPFLAGDDLIYRWNGDVERSCSVELRRRIIDSENVVTELTARSFGAIPVADLGPTSYENRIAVPLRIAEGPAVYQVTEIPQCSWLQRLFPTAIPYPPVEFTVTR